MALNCSVSSLTKYKSYFDFILQSLPSPTLFSTETGKDVDNEEDSFHSKKKDSEEKGIVTTMSKFWESFTKDQQYNGVKIEMKSTDANNFEKLKGQFLQSLCDNLRQRFPSSELIEAASCLHKSTWPINPLDLALFGERKIASLCKQFGISCTDAADTVLQYAIYKKSDGIQCGKNLKHRLSVLEVLPVSSADCERGFSQMNLYHTSERNRLLVSSVNDLLMIGINGPPITMWNAEKYAISWLKSGRRGALDKATGPPKKTEELTHRTNIFA